MSRAFEICARPRRTERACCQSATATRPTTLGSCVEFRSRFVHRKCLREAISSTRILLGRPMSLYNDAIQCLLLMVFLGLSELQSLLAQPNVQSPKYALVLSRIRQDFLIEHISFIPGSAGVENQPICDVTYPRQLGLRTVP